VILTHTRSEIIKDLKAKNAPKNLEILATANEEGKPKPIFWTTTEGKGRVFVSIY
jgi:type 1 glutamine amidotransferase